MSTNEQLNGINLQLFADGASAGASGGDGGTGANGATNGVAVSVPSSQKKGANPLADVKYGIQDGDNEQNAPAQEANSAEAEEATKVVDRVAEFEKLINGEFKDIYADKVQKTIQSRFKNSKDKENADKYKALAPTLELLSQKYNIDVTNVEALNKAIMDDDAYYEEEAMRLGIPTDQLKATKKIERENSALKKQLDEREKYEQAEKKVANWMGQEKEAKKTFPGQRHAAAAEG